LKRNHAYQLGVGGSPSPKRQNIIFDGDGKRISPDKSPLLLKAMHNETVGKTVSSLIHSKAKAKQNDNRT
jgi:hypothetical protein